MVAGDQPAPKAELKPSLTQAGGISARLDELTAVGSGGEGTQLLLRAREKHSLLGLGSGSYWFPTLFAIRGRAIPWTELGIYLAYTAAVCAVNTQIPSTQRTDQTSQLRQLSGVTSTIGILLFLLLSFRNNAAFQRWQTGADRFNSFCDKNKNLARLIAGNLPIYTATNKSEAYRHCLGNIRWLMVGVEMARQTLRGVRNEHCLADLVSDEAAMEALMASPDPPLHCLLQVQTRERLFRGEKDQKWFERADDMFLDFSACRSVLNTPIPFAYISHLRTFMVLWLAVVPWVFVVYFDWYTMLLCAVIGYGVVGVEEAAVEVEQPFGADFNDIPLDSIVAQTHKTMAGIMRYIREEQRRAIAAGEIEDSDDGEGSSTPGKLEQVVVSQDVTK